MTSIREPAVKERRRAMALLIAAALGIAVAVTSGLALVPRVRLVEVITVIGGGVGAGASLVGAIDQWRRSRRATAAAPDGPDDHA